MRFRFFGFGMGGKFIPGNSAIVTLLGWSSDPFEWLSSLPKPNH